MGECWNIPEARMLPRMDNLLLEERQVRAMANYFRTFHDADSFVAALKCAHALVETGDLASAAVWNQIAEEVSQLETHDALERYLKRGRENLPAGGTGRTPSRLKL